MLLLICLTLKGAITINPTPPIPTPSGGEGGRSNIQHSTSRHNEEEERLRLEQIREDDDIILSIVKVFLICQN